MKTARNGAAYSLSPMQQGMLFHSLSAREPGVDIEQILCGLPEEINGSAFERAWQRVVERHAILRTSFHWEGLGRPRQEARSRAKIGVQQQDWSGLSAEKRNQLLEAYL